MSNITVSEFVFRSSDGKTDIHVMEWVPEKVTGFVQIAHGMAEHKERYAGFAEYLCSNGYAVAAQDHLGHGKSIADESCRGFFAEHDGWFCVVDDVEKLREIESEKFSGVPYYMFGHSMGTFVMRTYIEKYPDAPVKGVILSGTGQNPGLILSIGKKIADGEVRKLGAKHISEKLNQMAFGKYNKKIENPRSEFDWLSVDNENVDGYIADSDCGYIMTSGFFSDMMGGLQYIWKSENIGKIRKDLPILLAAGDADPVGDYGKSVVKVAKAYTKAGISDVTVKLYSGYRHEILNESEIKDTVMDEILEWISSHI